MQTKRQAQAVHATWEGARWTVEPIVIAASERLCGESCKRQRASEWAELYKPGVVVEEEPGRVEAPNKHKRQSLSVSTT